MMDVIEPREEFVGKRVITKQHDVDINEWESGVIRCSCTDDDGLMFLIEWDHLNWEERDWSRLDDYEQLYLECYVCLRKLHHNGKDKVALAFSSMKESNDPIVLLEYFHNKLRYLYEQLLHQYTFLHESIGN
ncbi:uncharacterized protein LOC100178398 [Ciona intestinalis]